MKYILLFLIATLVNAAPPQIQRMTSEQLDQGYVIHFVSDGVIYCLGMPQMLDQAFIPQTWTTVPQAAIDYRWPVMTGEVESVCLSGINIPRVSYGKMYQINGAAQVYQSIDIPIGLPCGDRMSNVSFLRSVTYSGQTGFAICTGGL